MFVVTGVESADVFFLSMLCQIAILRAASKPQSIVTLIALREMAEGSAKKRKMAKRDY